MKGLYVVGLGGILGLCLQALGLLLMGLGLLRAFCVNFGGAFCYGLGGTLCFLFVDFGPFGYRVVKHFGLCDRFVVHDIIYVLLAHTRVGSWSGVKSHQCRFCFP